MFGITDPLTYLLGVFAIILIPGPNSLYCLSAAARYGTRAGFSAAAGIFCGDSVLILLTALGAASVLKTLPMLFFAVKVAGGLYLAYLGLNLLRTAVRSWTADNVCTGTVQKNPAPAETFRQPEHVCAHSFRHALMLSLVNPKAILFYLSFFVQFADPAYPEPALTFFALAVILQTVSMTYLSILVLAGVAAVAWFGRKRRLSAGSLGAVGLLFLGFAGKLWTA